LGYKEIPSRKLGVDCYEVGASTYTKEPKVMKLSVNQQQRSFLLSVSAQEMFFLKENTARETLLFTLLNEGKIKHYTTLEKPSRAEGKTKKKETSGEGSEPKDWRLICWSLLSLYI
jgi:hypothetical protein